MINEEKYKFIIDFCEKGGILVTESHPHGIQCRIINSWDSDVLSYFYDSNPDEDKAYVESIKYPIEIWSDCHDAELGVMYTTIDDISIQGNHITLTTGENSFGSMFEYMWGDEIEFKMYIPLTK